MFSIDNILNDRPLSSKTHVSPSLPRKRRRDEDEENVNASVSHWAATGRVPSLARDHTQAPNRVQDVPGSCRRGVQGVAVDECSRDSAVTTSSVVTPKSTTVCSSDDEMPAAKRKKSRTCFTSRQLDGLEAAFLKQRYLSATERKQVAATLGLKDQQVKTWYQNRRMKEKKQAPPPPVDCRVSQSPRRNHYVTMTKNDPPPNICVTSLTSETPTFPPRGLSPLPTSSVLPCSTQLSPIVPETILSLSTVAKQPLPQTSSPPPANELSSSPPPAVTSRHFEPLSIVTPPLPAVAYTQLTAASLLHPSQRLLKIANATSTPRMVAMSAATAAPARNFYHQSPTTSFLTAGGNYR